MNFIDMRSWYHGIGAGSSKNGKMGCCHCIALGFDQKIREVMVFNRIGEDQTLDAFCCNFCTLVGADFADKVFSISVNSRLNPNSSLSEPDPLLDLVWVFSFIYLKGGSHQ